MEYCFDSTLHEKLAQADALLAQVRQNLPQSPEERNRRLLEFLTRFTWNSAGIEGIAASLEQTRQVLNGLDVPEVSIEHRVQLTGCRDAFYYMRECVAQGMPLSQDLIRMFHFLCTPMGDDQRGRYRDVQIHVAIRTQVPPEPEDVPKAMDVLFAQYEACKLHPLLLAAWFHLAHEAIHPLHLANGRVERILINYLLMSRGYLPVCVRKEDFSRYIHSFDVYYETGDITPMAEYIIELEMEELRHCLEQV